MHKSVCKFGLFLMASLIVLSTVASASIGNTNLFENAMASEKYSNNYENSNGYANYESNDANYYQQPNNRLEKKIHLKKVDKKGRKILGKSM